MRATVILWTGLALATAACGAKTGEENAAAETGMTAESITANDVTAIDAVTGHDANMAADVDYSNEAFENLGNAGDAKTGAPKPKPAKPASDGLTDPIRDAGDEAATPANSAE